ncbi:hypothetical protein AB0B28_12240 [Glycomyces sp. NPDC046736]|uniref:hypothetical protein n=1 Tax=Glycomyces sp. NPDC046736 TaxID=3155615 RepID=UPI0033EAE0CF
MTTMRTRTGGSGNLTLALWAGLALSLIGGVAPLIDMATVDSLSAHVRQAYPQWPADLVGKDRDAIAYSLAAVGGLGAAVWAVSLWAVAKGRRWTRGLVTSAFAVGTLVALTCASLSGDQYDQVLPPVYSALVLLPSLAGLAAVVLVWRRR